MRAGILRKGRCLTESQAIPIMNFVCANNETDRRLIDQAKNMDGIQNLIAGAAKLVRDNFQKKQFAEYPEVFARRNRVTTEVLLDATTGSDIGREGVNELKQIADLLAAQGYGPDRIVIDPSVVRGLGYYTGPVYEAELTFDIQDEKGRPRQFGRSRVAGAMTTSSSALPGQAVPATGVSIGVDRLLAALTPKGA